RRPPTAATAGRPTAPVLRGSAAATPASPARQPILSASPETPSFRGVRRNSDRKGARGILSADRGSTVEGEEVGLIDHPSITELEGLLQGTLFGERLRYVVR